VAAYSPRMSGHVADRNRGRSSGHGIHGGTRTRSAMAGGGRPLSPAPRTRRQTVVQSDDGTEDASREPSAATELLHENLRGTQRNERLVVQRTEATETDGHGHEHEHRAEDGDGDGRASVANDRASAGEFIFDARANSP
jgi:hypothetical protein